MSPGGFGWCEIDSMWEVVQPLSELYTTSMRFRLAGVQSAQEFVSKVVSPSKDVLWSSCDTFFERKTGGSNASAVLLHGFGRETTSWSTSVSTQVKTGTYGVERDSKP